MADAGRILIIPKGTYDANVSYEMLDLVSYNDASWLAKKSVAGVEPSDANSEYWFKMVDNTAIQAILNGTTAVGNAQKLNGLTAEEFVKGVSPFFASGETILSWAINPNGVYKKFVISAHGYPSDVPIKLEGFATLDIDQAQARRTVTYHSFAGTGYQKKYVRSIYANAWYSEWEEFAVASKVLPLDGSVPMSGSILKINNDLTRVGGDSNHVGIVTLNGASNESNHRAVIVKSQSYEASGTNAVIYRECVDGAMTDYTVLHTGNMANHVLPLDGSVPMSGVLTVPEWVDVNSANDNTKKARVGYDGVNNRAYLINYDSANSNWRGVYADLNADASNGLKYLNAPKGVETFYTIHHDGNSAKVVVSSTPLTAEGSVRVW